MNMKLNENLFLTFAFSDQRLLRVKLIGGKSNMFDQCGIDFQY